MVEGKKGKETKKKGKRRGKKRKEKHNPFYSAEWLHTVCMIGFCSTLLYTSKVM
jgi:hypothetical protein